jgi:hypothetical protein
VRDWTPLPYLSLDLYGPIKIRFERPSHSLGDLITENYHIALGIEMERAEIEI